MRLPRADAPPRFSVAFDDGSCEVLFENQLCSEEPVRPHLWLVPPPADAGRQV